MMKAEYVKPNVHFEMFTANIPVAKNGDGSGQGGGSGSTGSTDVIVSGCGVNSTVFFDCFQGNSVDQTLVLSTYFNIANGTGDTTTAKSCSVQAGFADYRNITDADQNGNSEKDPDDITQTWVNLGNNLSSEHTTHNSYIEWENNPSGATYDTADVQGSKSILDQFLGWFYISYTGNSATEDTVNNSYWSVNNGVLTYSGSVGSILHAALAPVFSMRAITSL